MYLWNRKALNLQLSPLAMTTENKAIDRFHLDPFYRVGSRLTFTSLTTRTKVEDLEGSRISKKTRNQKNSDHPQYSHRLGTILTFCQRDSVLGILIPNSCLIEARMNFLIPSVL